MGLPPLYQVSSRQKESILYEEMGDIPSLEELDEFDLYNFDNIHFKAFIEAAGLVSDFKHPSNRDHKNTRKRLIKKAIKL